MFDVMVSFFFVFHTEIKLFQVHRLHSAIIKSVTNQCVYVVQLQRRRKLHEIGFTAYKWSKCLSVVSFWTIEGDYTSIFWDYTMMYYGVKMFLLLLFVFFYLPSVEWMIVDLLNEIASTIFVCVWHSMRDCKGTRKKNTPH